MTGSGKTGLCVGVLEEAAIDGVPSIIIDPKGDLANLMLTFPALRAGGLPALDQRGRRRQGRRLARRLRHAAGRAVDEGSRRLGPGRRAHPAPARRGRLRDLHARQRRRPARLRARLVRAARRIARTPRPSGDQIGAIATGLLALARHRRRPDQEPRAHPALEHPRRRLGERPGARPRRADRADPAAAVRQDRRARPRLVLPAEGPLRARAGAQQPARRAGLPALDAGRAARRRAACCAARAASRASRSSRSRTSRTPSACSS